MPKKTTLPVEPAAPAKNKNKAAAAVEPPSKLPTFSLLTTAWGLGLQASKGFDQQGARPEPSDLDAVANAWRLATEPGSLAIGAIYQAAGPAAFPWQGFSSYGYDRQYYGQDEDEDEDEEGYDGDDEENEENELLGENGLRDARPGQQHLKRMPPSLLFFDILSGGMADAEVAELAKGIDALAADISQVASSKALLDGARVHGRLLATPAADGALSYPLLGLGVKAAKVSLNGLRADSLTAHSLARAGQVQGVKLDKSSEITPLSSADWVAAPKLPATDVAAAAAELSSVRRDLLARKPFDQSRGYSTIEDFGALAALDGSSMPADTELPQISKLALFAAPAQEARDIYWRKYAGGNARFALGVDPFASKNKRAAMMPQQYSRAIGSLENGPWMDLLSAGLAPEVSGLLPGQERFSKLRPDAGPMALARFGPWDKQGSDQWISWINSDAIEKLLRANGHTHSYYRHASDRTAELLGASCMLLSKLRLDGKSAEAAQFERELASAAIKTKLDFGSLGRGLAGLTGILRAENPRIGLLQWAMAALLTRQNAFASENNAFFTSQNDSLALFDPAPHAPGSPEAAAKFALQDERRAAAWAPMALAQQSWPARATILNDALNGLSASMALVRRTFVQSAISAAQETEDAWLAAHGLLAPFRQAQAAGAATPQAVAWSSLNPLAASMSSSNPAIRAAAICARPLGFRAADSDAELLSSFRAALLDRGASGDAIAALEASEPALMFIQSIVSNISSPDKALRTFGSEALAFSLHAMNAWVEQKLAPDEAALFLAAHLATDGPFGKPGRNEGRPRQDGIFPSLAKMAVSSPEEARAAQALLDGKAVEYPAMVASLVHDWAATVAQARQMGLPEAAGTSLAASRARVLGEAFPESFSIDWAAKPFSSREAWAALGVSSPRLSLALKDASSRGGLAGEWCAEVAPRLGILDAVDGNDVIAKVRDSVKARLGIADGVWRAAIKSRESLAPLSRAMVLAVPVSRYQAAIDKNAALIASEAPKISTDLAGSLAGAAPDTPYSYEAARRAEELRASASIALGLSAAAANNIALDAATAIISNVCEPFEPLGHPSIPPVKVDSAEGAAFFIAEHEAKAQRLPVIFKEAAKRFEKLRLDSAKPPKKGDAPINPANEISGEASDLSDWISGSEHGIWQTLPEKPTWGQLSRLSKAWHDEVATVAADREDRRSVARESAHARSAAAAIARREANARGAAELAADARRRPKLSAAEAFEQTHKDKLAALESAKKSDQNELRKIEQAANKFIPTERAKWATVIGRHTRDAWEAIELDSAASLTEEGREMAHCVSSYASSSRDGSCRIFSIRLNGERQCTLEVRARESFAALNPNSIFAAVQNKGRHNAPVRNAATLVFCTETVAQVQQAWVKISEDGGLKPAAKKEAQRLKESIKERTAAIKELAAAGERELLDKIVARRLGKAPATSAVAGGKADGRRSRNK